MGLFKGISKLISPKRTVPFSVPIRQKHNSYSLSEWDRKWVCIGPLKTANLTPYNHCVGLYRHVINGETVYVGRAIELNNGGFRKRLSDYRRESDSGRTHTSGRLINQNLSTRTNSLKRAWKLPSAATNSASSSSLNTMLRRMR